MLEVTGKLRRKLIAIIYSTVLDQISKAIKSKEKSISTLHTKKINKFRQRQRQIRSMHNHSRTYLKYRVCNMSSYELFHEEYTPLSFGLDHLIPSKTDANLIWILNLRLTIIVLNTKLQTYQRPKNHIPKQN